MRQNGFSLLELLITLAIIAILLGLSEPHYRAQINAQRHQQATMALHALSMEFSAYHLRHNHYIDIEKHIRWPRIPNYQFQLTHLSENHYTITATPKEKYADPLIMTERGIQTQHH